MARALKPEEKTGCAFAAWMAFCALVSIGWLILLGWLIVSVIDWLGRH